MTDSMPDETPQTSWWKSIDSAAALAIIDSHFSRAMGAGHAPGIAYALIADGQIVHERGLGAISVDNGPSPDSHTAFRIASMTKSFTAMTLLSLRDEGRLTLDEPVISFVSELAAGGPDAANITVRHLLTMGAGFATDDPWGDRQQDLAVDAFRDLLASGVRPVLQPGDRFEYSNMGYALAGLVISAVGGDSYPDVVRERVLDPLGLTETGFDPDHLDTRAVATGYVKRSNGWQVEPLAAVGAFAPMGGLFSTVSDLAVWIDGFLGSATVHSVVTDVSLREMQRTQRLAGVVGAADPGKPPTVTGYGFGLFEEQGPVGRIVFHSGGYPGFGSHMRWHPASRVGVVALANGTYAPMSLVAQAAMAELLDTLDAPTTVPLPGLDGLGRAEAAVRAWLAAEKPDGPEGQALRELWSDNVERDLPWPERLIAWQSLRDQCGPLIEVDGSRRRVEAATVTWTLRPAATEDKTEAAVRITVMMAPHDSSLVQSLTVRAIRSDQPRRAVLDVS
jgi:CubicO group peptidase (beta-lactamase class C family)